MSNERVAESQHPFDVCKCGDYRHQHFGGTGRCSLGDLCTPYPCSKFRLQRGPNAEDLKKPDPGRLVPPHGSGGIVLNEDKPRWCGGKQP